MYECRAVSGVFRIIDSSLLQYNSSTFKGIDQPFELRVESKLIRSVMTNWRLGYFFYHIINGLHHKISKKPLDAT
jgi:hypothetical protein